MSLIKNGTEFSRRSFLKAVGAGAVVTALGRGATSTLSAQPGRTNGAPRPNILWISAEDISPDLGCYGDTYADTPNLDRFAAESVRYTNAFTPAGVCAPCRSATITGMYQSSIGTQHMRCKGVPPAQVKCFPEYLRAAGYYCTNNSKTDYQFNPPFTAWDESSSKAHWRNRRSGQPFFSIFNLTVSHEAEARRDLKDLVHDPDKAELPPYYPDTPIVRKNWASYYDNITIMDSRFRKILDQLEADGLTEDTIVWFWGDHGRGLPRAKRWIYDSGLKVPLMIRVPKKFYSLVSAGNTRLTAPGTVNDELVSFVDFAPTMLSLTGVDIPAHLQGRAFLGKDKAEPCKYIYGARDRMDEAYDMIRCVRDKRFKYIRNFMYHLTYALDIKYMNEMPIMQEMRRLNAEGKLKDAEKNYFLPEKPVHELYDTISDPHEINNLASDPNYKDTIERMKNELFNWMQRIRDVGLIPEPDFDRMKRPGDEYEQTAEPQFSQQAAKISITCPTQGSSIAYRFAYDPQGQWKLYTEPVALKTGRQIIAKACRLGFKDSKEVSFKSGDNAAAGTATATKQRIHWREQVDSTDMLDQLFAVKQLDGGGNKVVPEYFRTLKSKYGPVRYWAVVGLHNECTSDADLNRAKAAFIPMLNDTSPSVRIAAAEALCDWGRENKALPVLTKGLENTAEKERLFAATSLGRIGKKARP
ncbi:MAG: sulfatase-like hydrolase/transferase, partial [Planctomycetota bacterium]